MLLQCDAGSRTWCTANACMCRPGVLPRGQSHRTHSVSSTDASHSVGRLMSYDETHAAALRLCADELVVIALRSFKNEGKKKLSLNDHGVINLAVRIPLNSELYSIKADLLRRYT